MPVILKAAKFCAAGLGDVVVAAGSFVVAHLPVAGDQSRLLQAIEQGIDGAVAGEQTADGVEVFDELQPVARFGREQREDARSDDTPPQLGARRGVGHAADYILRRKTTQWIGGLVRMVG